MYLLFDIGGTKTRIATSTDHKKLDKTTIFRTPHLFDETLEKIKNEATNLASGKPFAQGAGSIATPLDTDRTKVVSDSKKNTFTNWIDQPLKKQLEQIFSIPIFLENDAAMGGLGEAVYGAGKGHNIVMYLTIGTGVGGAKITNGHIDENALGFEPGKQIIDSDGTLIPEDEPPLTLNELVGGMFIEKRKEMSPEKIDDQDFWDKTAYYLSLGLNTSIVHWSPDVVVLGGSLMKKIPIDKVRSNLQSILKGLEKLPPLKLGTLGDKCGLYGALHYLNTQK